MDDWPIIVADTNTVVRAFANWNCASGVVLKAAESHRVRLLLSRSVVAEYRRVLSDPELQSRYPEVNASTIAVVLRRLKYMAGSFVVVRSHFEFDRDPDDAKFLELAIDGQATDLLTYDRDILSIRAGHGEAAKRFRQRSSRTKIRRPEEFLRDWRG